MKESRNYSKCEIVSVTIYDNVEYPMHFHSDMEMIFVLEGAARVHTSFYTIDRMDENNFLFINSSTIHNIEKLPDEPCRIMSIHFRTEDIAGLFSLPELSAFSIASFDEFCSPEIIAQLRRYLVDIASEYYSLQSRDESRISDMVLECYTYMMNNFQWFYYEDYILRNYPQRLPLSQITRAEEVLTYLQAHYSERLSLTEVADAFFLSKYYLSHLLKDTLGMNFQDLLNAIRLHIALYPLLDSKKSVEEIAEECGFSSAPYFRKAFAKQAKVQLSTYRKTYAKRTLSVCRPDIREYSEEEQEQLLTEYKMKYFPREFFSTGVKRIPINVELKKPPCRHSLPEAFRTLKFTPAALMSADLLGAVLGELKIRTVTADMNDFVKMQEICGSWNFFEPIVRICREKGIKFELCGEAHGGRKPQAGGPANIVGKSQACGPANIVRKSQKNSTADEYEINALNEYKAGDMEPMVCDLMPTICGTEFSMYGHKGLRTCWYYLYFMLDQLYDEVIFESEDCTITRSGNEICILFYNIPGKPEECPARDTNSMNGTNQSTGNNFSCGMERLVQSVRDIRHSMSGGTNSGALYGTEKKEIFLHLEDIECNYMIISYTWGCFSESEEDVWCSIGAPDSMGSAVRETIRNSCFPEVTYAHSASQYDLLKEIALQPGEMKLMRLIPEEPR